MHAYTFNNTAPECPHCGYTHSHDCGFFYNENLTRYDCDRCDKPFAMEVITQTWWRCTPDIQP